MIAAADQRVNVSARHVMNNTRRVAAQFTVVSRSRPASCSLSTLCRQSRSSVLTSNIEFSKFVLHPYPWMLEPSVKVFGGIVRGSMFRHHLPLNLRGHI